MTRIFTEEVHCTPTELADELWDMNALDQLIFLHASNTRFFTDEEKGNLQMTRMFQELNNCDEAYVKEMLLQLSKLGAKISVLTGVGFKEGMTGVMGYDKEADEFFYYSNEKLAKSYHGTGDVFASTLVGAMMNGLDW